MKAIREMLHGNLLIFTLGDAIRQLSMFITFPYFSLYIQALGGSIVDIGVVNSVRPFAALFMYPIAGYIADKYSRVKIIAASGYISAGLYTIHMLAPNWKVLTLGNFLAGLMVFYFPAFNALIADSLAPRRRGIGYSLWWVFPSALGIISPYIGGYLITILGVEQAMRVLYGLTIITTGMIATMNLKFLKETKTGTGEKTVGRGFWRMLSDSYRNVGDVLRWLPRRLKVFTLILILSFFMNTLAAPYWIVHGVGEIGLSELQWGMVLLIAAVTYVALLIPAGMIVDRYGGKKVISLALAVAVFPTFLFPFSRSLINTILLFVLVTIANAFLASGAPAYMAEAVPTEKRGRVMAVLGQGMLFVNTRGLVGGPGMGAILTIPSILGSVLGGVVYNYNAILPWSLLSIAMIFSVVIFLSFAPEDENKGTKKGDE